MNEIQKLQVEQILIDYPMSPEDAISILKEMGQLMLSLSPGHAMSEFQAFIEKFGQR